MADELNHLRMKSRKLAEEIKALKAGSKPASENSHAPSLKALEVDMPEESGADQSDDIEIVSPSTSSRAHFPGEHHTDEESR